MAAWRVRAAQSQTQDVQVPYLSHESMRPFRMALAALTRIDVSGNRLECLSSHFLQLPSLRTLNAGHNRICRLETSVEGWNAPMLETINLEHNLIDRLPDMVR